MKKFIAIAAFVTLAAVSYTPQAAAEVDIHIGIPFPGVVIQPPVVVVPPDEYYSYPRYTYPYSEPPRYYYPKPYYPPKHRGYHKHYGHKHHKHWD